MAIRACVVFGVILGCVGTAAAVDQLAEEFVAPSLGGWSGGSEAYTNPGTGGVDGDGDGYLEIANFRANNFAARNIEVPYIGDYAGEGVRRVIFYANDVGIDDDLTIYFGLGEGPGNFWVRTAPIVTPAGEWALNVIDIENADVADWTQIGFGGTDAAAFAMAVANTTRIVIRHDDPSDGFDSILLNDDEIVGDLGIDRFIIAKDCDTNDIAGLDCNGNGIVDECDIAFGDSLDADGDGVPDECGAGIPGDFNNDGDVDTGDLLQLLGAWGPCPGCVEDIDGDGMVSTTDLLILLSNWT